MEKTTYLLMVLLLSVMAYHVGRRRAATFSVERRLHSLPSFHGYHTALWCALPALLVLGVWLVLEPPFILQSLLTSLPAELLDQSPEAIERLIYEIRSAAHGVDDSQGDARIDTAIEHYRHQVEWSNRLLAITGLIAALGGAFFAYRQIHPDQRARNRVERAITLGLIACATIAIFTTLGIVLSVLIESIRFFNQIPVTEFLFGLKWNPQIAIRADQVGSDGAFGAVPLLTGTALIASVAMAVAVPIGLMSAIYLSEYASPRFRATAKPLLEILAGIPTVVYGFFAALVVAPFIRDLGIRWGLDVSSESALAAGLVMGIMIIPFVSSLSDDFINAVPQSLRDGAYALGATPSETIRQVIMPAALPGVVGGILLAISRAIGETMIVVMAAGLSARLTANPLEAVTTVTTQIVTLLVGDQEFDSPKTLAAFALGLLLFLLTLMLNIIALHIVRKYREHYE